MPPYSYPPPRRASTTEGENDTETSTNPRSTPLSFWGEEAQGYPQYPPYYDPYYYYYYGYPPMYPPYPYYGPNSDTDDFAGYSSTDEMAYYNSQKGRRRNSFSGRRSATPKILVTPTLNIKETVLNKKVEIEKPELEPEEEINTSESDSDTETEEDNKRNSESNPLKSIRSVNNIHLYADEGDSHCSDDEVAIEEYTEDGNEEIDEENSMYLVDDDSYPHQLSVIYEESERTDSRMRSASALSDSTTIAERSDDEDTSPNIMNANKPFKFCVSVTEEEKEDIKAVVSIRDGEIKSFQGNLETPSIIIEESDSINKEHKQEDIEEHQITRQDDHIQSNDEEEDKKSDESEDWWGILGKDDDLPTPPPIILKKGNNSKEDTSSNDIKDAKTAISSENKSANIEKTVNVHKKKEELQVSHPVEREVKPKNNYARAKSVYDKIEDEFEEEINTGKLIELESFVAKLEQMQKESGLWNIQLPRKVGDNSRTANGKQNANKEKIYNTKTKGEQYSVNKETNTFKFSHDKTEENEEIDFWSTLKNEEDEVVPRSKIVSKDNCSASYNNYSCSKSRSGKNEEKETAPVHQNTSVNEMTVKSEGEYYNPKASKASEESYVNKRVVESEDSSEEIDSSEDESEEHEQKENDLNDNEEQEIQPMSIQERIQALKETIKQKQNKLQQQQEQEMKTSVKEKISAIETTGQNRSKTTSTKSSLKSFEEYSEEEEGDSGVTSDMSRHISDTEEFPELKKLTRYQRAATHSRLFKLLQDECENEEDEEDEEKEEDKSATDSNNDKFGNSSPKNNAPNTDPPRRDKLSLPLKTNETESLCSSGITSPGSPVNEKLVNELVQSLLKRKKGQIFRNMPKEKLFAAAARILQEDLEGLDASSEDCSSFLSPLRDSTGCSTAAQTPQEFNGTYDEYKQYYETWSEAERIYDENYDILPSKAFKLLQEHSNLSKTGAIAGLLAKCPRVLSSKNIHKKLLKLLESSGTSSPTPDNPLESNEVTSAS